MRYVLLLMFYLLSSSMYGRADELAMEFEYNVWDFGKINEADGVVSHDFTFRNIGKKPFVIDNIAVSCGCTSSDFSKEPIMPNKTATITITFDPTGRPGIFAKDVVVTSNNRKNRCALMVQGDVVGKPIPIEDEYPIIVGASGLRLSMQSQNMGYVEQGSVSNTAIRYVNVTSKPLEVIVKSYTANRDSSSSKSYTIEPKARGEFSISCDLRNRTMYGMYNLPIEYSVNGVLQSLMSSVTVIGTPNFQEIDRSKAPKAKFVSTFKYFGEVDKGGVVKHNFTLKNEGHSDLVISNIQLAKGLTSTLDKDEILAPNDEVSFEVSLDTSDYNKGRVFANMYITFNDPQRPFRELRTVVYVE